MPTAFTLIVLTFGAGTNAPPGVAMHSLPTRQACERAAAAVERVKRESNSTRIVAGNVATAEAEATDYSRGVNTGRSRAGSA